jgi:hypothetical protein
MADFVSPHWDGDRIARDLRNSINRGVTAAAVFLKGRIKEILSEPAPRVRLNTVGTRTGPYGETLPPGTPYYVAGWEIGKKNKAGPGGTVQGSRLVKNRKTGAYERKRITYKPSPATPGAPPRKLSGRLRSSVDYEVQQNDYGGWDVTARIGTNVIYARPLETGGHAFMLRSLMAFKTEIEQILGRGVGGATVRSDRS